jgi:hypothetical protein
MPAVTTALQSAIVIHLGDRTGLPAYDLQMTQNTQIAAAAKPAADTKQAYTSV